MPSGGRAGQAQAQGRGPGPARLGLGPGRAGGCLAFCIYLRYLGYILDIFGFQGCISLGHLSPVKSYCTHSILKMHKNTI